MKNNKYKVLVLMDLKDNTNDLLNYTTRLLKEIDADVEFFYVKKPTDVIYTDSQLSAMRNINRDCINTDRQIKKIVAPLLNNSNLKVKRSYAFGHVKSEIKYKIQSVNPDVIVLGKSTPKRFNLIGDHITDFVFQIHKGAVLIASEFDKLNAISSLKTINNNQLAGVN